MKKTSVYIILTALLLTLFCGCRDDGEVPGDDMAPDVSPIMSVTPGIDGDDDDNGIIPGDDADDGDVPDAGDALVSTSPKTAPSANK